MGELPYSIIDCVSPGVGYSAFVVEGLVDYCLAGGSYVLSFGSWLGLEDCEGELLYTTFSHGKLGELGFLKTWLPLELPCGSLN